MAYNYEDSQHVKLVSNLVDMLRIKRRLFVVISGKTGSGKTTLCRYLQEKFVCAVFQTDSLIGVAECEHVEILDEFKNSISDESICIFEGCVAHEFAEKYKIAPDYRVFVDGQKKRVVDCFSGEPFFCENTKVEVLDKNVFGDSQSHSASKAQANFVLITHNRGL